MYSYTHHAKMKHIVNPTIIPIVVSDSFTDEQADDITKAINEWNLVLNGQIVLKEMENTFGSDAEGLAIQAGFEKSSNGIVVYGFMSDNPILKGVPDGALAFVTDYDANAVTVIVDRLGTRSLRVIFAHEMAHILGANHVNAPTLEYPVYGNIQTDCIDRVVVAQVATMRGLNFDNLNYCITPMFP